jgi:transcriptional regulator with XRE-family HTH domain
MTAPVPRRASSFEPAVAVAFGEVIRTERVKKKIAQDAFALIAGIDRSYYGKLERGERQPSIGLLLRIAGGLGCSAATLVKRLEIALGRTPPSS